MNERIEMTRCVRVFSSVIVLTAVAMIGAMQARAATILYVTTDTSAFAYTTATSTTGAITTTFTGPDAGSTWTDAFALALSASSKVYVADAGTNNVYEYLNTTTGSETFSSSFTTTPDAGDTISPQEIALVSGSLFTTSQSNGFIDKYSGSTPSSFETLPGARGILANSTTMYVDQEGYGSFILDSFSTSGGTVTSHTFTPSCGTGVVCGQVRGMAIVSGNLYLADSTWTNGDGQIDEINLSTFAITTFLAEGTTDLDDPNALTTDGTNLYVADYGNGMISEYALSGGGLVGHWTVGGHPQGVILAGTEDNGTAQDPGFFTQVTPEPGTASLLLLAAGILAAAGCWRRKVSATRLS